MKLAVVKPIGPTRVTDQEILRLRFAPAQNDRGANHFATTLITVGR